MIKSNSQYKKMSCLKDIHREIESLSYLIEKKEIKINNDINDIKNSLNLFSIIKKTFRDVTPYISIGYLLQDGCLNYLLKKVNFLINPDDLFKIDYIFAIKLITNKNNHYEKNISFKFSCHILFSNFFLLF